MAAPREARGGAIAPADIPVLKEALYSYLDKIITEDENHPNISKIASLLHRLGRIA